MASKDRQSRTGPKQATSSSAKERSGSGNFATDSKKAFAAALHRSTTAGLAG